MDNLNRREFVLGVAAAGAACYLCATGSTAQAADSTPAPTVDAGPISDFKQDGPYGNLAKDQKVLVYRENGRLYASSAACTHRKVLLKVVDGQARCPAHGSRFDVSGKPLRGPADKPLARFAVSVNAQKHLIIDTTRTFDEKQWDDPAAFVAVR